MAARSATSTAEDGNGQPRKSEAFGGVEPACRGDKPEKRLTRRSLLRRVRMLNEPRVTPDDRSAVDHPTRAALGGAPSPPTAAPRGRSTVSHPFAIPLAAQCAHVLAVDLSDVMLATLRTDAAHLPGRVDTMAADLADLQLPAASYDVIVSSYAMHYLLDADKQALLARMHEWLAPGGRVVIADMMLGRSLDEHHRRVLAQKAASMLRMGPAGWWRLLTNIVRIGTGRGRLHASPPDWWLRTLRDSGYGDVEYEHVFSEAGIVTGRRAG